MHTSVNEATPLLLDGRTSGPYAELTNECSEVITHRGEGSGAFRSALPKHDLDMGGLDSNALLSSNPLPSSSRTGYIICPADMPPDFPLLLEVYPRPLRMCGVTLNLCRRDSLVRCSILHGTEVEVLETDDDQRQIRRLVRVQVKSLPHQDSSTTSTGYCQKVIDWMFSSCRRKRRRALHSSPPNTSALFEREAAVGDLGWIDSKFVFLRSREILCSNIVSVLESPRGTANDLFEWCDDVSNECLTGDCSANRYFKSLHNERKELHHPEVGSLQRGEAGVTLATPPHAFAESSADGHARTDVPGDVEQATGYVRSTAKGMERKMGQEVDFLYFLRCLDPNNITLTTIRETYQRLFATVDSTEEISDASLFDKILELPGFGDEALLRFFFPQLFDESTLETQDSTSSSNKPYASIRAPLLSREPIEIDQFTNTAPPSLAPASPASQGSTVHAGKYVGTQTLITKPVSSACLSATHVVSADALSSFLDALSRRAETSQTTRLWIRFGQWWCSRIQSVRVEADGGIDVHVDVSAHSNEGTPFYTLSGPFATFLRSRLNARNTSDSGDESLRFFVSRKVQLRLVRLSTRSTCGLGSFFKSFSLKLVRPGDVRCQGLFRGLTMNLSGELNSTLSLAAAHLNCRISFDELLRVATASDRGVDSAVTTPWGDNIHPLNTSQLEDLVRSVDIM